MKNQLVTLLKIYTVVTNRSALPPSRKYMKLEWLAAEDLFMDDLRAFDRDEIFDVTYKEKIKKLANGQLGQNSDEKRRR